MKLNTTNKLRRVSAMLVFAIGLGYSLAPTTALAGRTTAYTIEYYSDATLTDLVGVYQCGCVTCHLSGVKTAYAVKTDEFSCDIEP